MKIPVIDQKQLYKSLGFTKIPKDLELLVENVTLKEFDGKPIFTANVQIILQKNLRQRQHRILVICPICSKKIPFGRLRQHFKIH